MLHDLKYIKLKSEYVELRIRLHKMGGNAYHRKYQLLKDEVDEARREMNAEARVITKTWTDEFEMFSATDVNGGGLIYAGGYGWAYRTGDDGSWNVWEIYQDPGDPIATNISESDAVRLIMTGKRK